MSSWWSDVAIPRGDESDVVAERGLGGKVSVVPSRLVVVREDEGVDQSQAGEVGFWRRCEGRGDGGRLEGRCGQHRPGAVADAHGAACQPCADGVAEPCASRDGQQRKGPPPETATTSAAVTTVRVWAPSSGKSEPSHFQAGLAQFAFRLTWNVLIVERVRRVGDQDRV